MEAKELAYLSQISDHSLPGTTIGVLVQDILTTCQNENKKPHNGGHNRQIVAWEKRS